MKNKFKLNKILKMHFLTLLDCTFYKKKKNKTYISIKTDPI
jgi:hypothetical protein